jgi:ASC-1-like (ASCH) protein
MFIYTAEMNTIQQHDENPDENPDGFNQLNENVKEGYKSLMGTFPKVKKIKCKKFVHEMNVDDIWFSHILEGRKTIEGRLCKGKYKFIKRDDDIIINQKLRKNISNVRFYPSFEEYLRNEELNNCLPGIETIEEGIMIYRKFYTKKDEKTYGIVAIELM